MRNILYFLYTSKAAPGIEFVSAFNLNGKMIRFTSFAWNETPYTSLN